MKKLIIIVSVFYCLGIHPGHAQTSPEEVFKTFMKAMQKKDIDRAKTITHSKFHPFLGMMADAKLKEGADTVDRIDYKGLQFKALGEGGIIKFKNNGADELFYLAKEEGQWKVDLFGTVGNLGVGMMVMAYGSSEESPVKFVLEFDYRIGGLQVKKVMNDETKPDMPMIRQFLAEEIVRLNLKIDPPNAAFTFNLDYDAKPGGGGELQSLISNPSFVNGVYEYTKK